MSRALSTAAKQAIYAQQTGEAFLLLLVIDHDDLADPIRVVNAGENVSSGGNTYVAFPFRIVLPPEGDDRPPTVRLQIDNVDRTIVASLRALDSPPEVSLSVVLASSPDTIEGGPFAFTLKSANYDALAVEGELAYEDTLNEPYPADSFDPTRFPGLFQ